MPSVGLLLAFVSGIAASIVAWLMLVRFGGRTKVRLDTYVRSDHGPHYHLTITVGGKVRTISELLATAQLYERTENLGLPILVRDIPASVPFDRAQGLKAKMLRCKLVLDAEDRAMLRDNNAFVSVSVLTVAGVARTERRVAHDYYAAAFSHLSLS